MSDAIEERRQELYRVEGRILHVEERLKPLTPDEKASLRAEIRRLRTLCRRLLAEIKAYEQPPLL